MLSIVPGTNISGSGETQRAEVTTLILVGAAIVLSFLVSKLLPKPEGQSPVKSDKEITSSIRGSYIPLLIGSRKISAVIGWVGQRKIKNRQNQRGKGFDSGGGASGQDEYEESGVHWLCVGPAYAITRIWEQGKLVWGGRLVNDVLAPSDPHAVPDGTVILDDKTGRALIYWGNQNGEINSYLSSTDRIGVMSRWPNLCYVVWQPKKLGMQQTWQLLDYEIEVRPRSSLSGGSPTWIEEVLQEEAVASDIFESRQSTGNQNATFTIRGDRRRDFYPGKRFVVINWPGLTPPAGTMRTVLESSYASQQRTDRTGQRPLRDMTIQPPWTVSIPVPITFNSTLGYWLVRVSAPHGPSTAEVGFGTFAAGQTVQTLLFFIHRPQPGEANNLPLNFVLEFKNRTVTRSHGIKFNWNRITQVLTRDLTYDTNGAILSVFSFTGARWDIQITYATGDGTLPSSSTDFRAVNIIATPDGSLPAGSQAIGVRIEGSVEEEGTIITVLESQTGNTGTPPVNAALARLINTQYPGANPAHVIWQLLFEPSPWGMGLPTDFFDISTLEALGLFFEASGTETTPVHVYGKDGATFDKLLATMMADLGILMPTDSLPSTQGGSDGLIRFDVLRQDTGPWANISEDLLLEPVPERDVYHHQIPVNQAIFRFPDRERFYRDSTISLADDGKAAYDDNPSATIEEMQIFTDIFTAETAAQRKELEVLSNPPSFKVVAGRDTRLLKPGRVITVEGIPTRCRILNIKRTAGSGRTELSLIGDFYAAEPVIPVTFSRGANNERSQPGADVASPQPIPDIDFTVWDVHRAYLPAGATSSHIVVLRARNAETRSLVWVSNDDFTYQAAGNASAPSLKGTLTTALPGVILTGDDVYEETDTIDIEFQGVDRSILLDYTLLDATWKRGDGVWIFVGDPMGSPEILFPKKMEVISTTALRVTGFIRANVTNSGYAARASGTEVWLTSRTNLNAAMLQHPFLVYNQPLYIKAQSIAQQGAALSLALITAKKWTNYPAKGTGPLYIRTVRVGGFSPVYIDGEDITVSWTMVSEDAEHLRTGAGTQGYGSVTGSAIRNGYYQIGLDAFPALTATHYEIETTATQHTFSAALLASLLGNPTTKTFVFIQVVYIEVGRASNAVTLVLTPITPVY